jgi:hypothetical protein
LRGLRRPPGGRSAHGDVEHLGEQLLQHVDRNRGERRRRIFGDYLQSRASGCEQQRRHLRRRDRNRNRAERRAIAAARRTRALELHANRLRITEQTAEPAEIEHDAGAAVPLPARRKIFRHRRRKIRQSRRAKAAINR